MIVKDLLSQCSIEEVISEIMCISGVSKGKRKEEIETILKTLVLLDSYGFEFISWGKVLGYQVDERSLMEFGKACMLARVIYEMTFFGFTEDQIAKERKKLDDAIAESEQIKNLPPEKGNSCNIN